MLALRSNEPVASTDTVEDLIDATCGGMRIEQNRQDCFASIRSVLETGSLRWSDKHEWRPMIG